MSREPCRAVRDVATAEVETRAGSAWRWEKVFGGGARIKGASVWVEMSIVWAGKKMTLTLEMVNSSRGAGTLSKCCSL